VSFGVYSDDDGKSRKVAVRMRAYPDGRERDYRGENPHAWGGPIVFSPPPSNGPRLIKDGRDLTPPSEPDPLVTVDRVGIVETKPGGVARVRFVLHGACVGTSARLGDDPSRVVIDQAQTCVDTERTLVSAATAPREAADSPARTGTWLADAPCPPPDNSSARVCVPGGATVFGADGASTGALEPSSPVRLLGVSRFFLDRREVTVGRVRDAFARGFKPPSTPYDADPHTNDAPLDESLFGKCTYSSKPIGREDYAVNCVSWIVAHAFCRSRVAIWRPSSSGSTRRRSPDARARRSIRGATRRRRATARRSEVRRAAPVCSSARAPATSRGRRAQARTT